jgi:prophage antirepressor-like protein
VAVDVCDILGIDTRNLRRDLDNDEIQTLNLRGSGRASLIISESGLYSLMLRSRKEEAKPFKKWVTKEVLPSIRKTGSYSIDPIVDPTVATLQ